MFALIKTPYCNKNPPVTIYALLSNFQISWFTRFFAPPRPGPPRGFLPSPRPADFHPRPAPPRTSLVSGLDFLVLWHFHPVLKEHLPYCYIDLTMACIKEHTHLSFLWHFATLRISEHVEVNDGFLDIKVCSQSCCCTPMWIVSQLIFVFVSGTNGICVSVFLQG